MLNYNTTYRSSIGCEPSKVFNGRIPYNVLDHNLGNIPDKNFFATTEFAEETQRRTQIFVDQTKKTIMQSYLNYKEYYAVRPERPHKQENDYCLVFKPNADSQNSKIPFRDYRWIGHFIVQKVLPNNNYIVRRSSTNKTQVLHRIRLKKDVLRDNWPTQYQFRLLGFPTHKRGVQLQGQTHHHSPFSARGLLISETEMGQ